ncbi:hypothetical protein [Paenibacillus sp. BAC0078]
MTDRMSGVVWLLVAYLIIVGVAAIAGKRNRNYIPELKKTLLTIGGIFVIVAFFVLFVI